MSFSGLRVLSLESRRAAETAQLIRRQDGEPVIAPSMREVPLEENSDVIRFGERLLAGGFDMTIFLTGVGTRFLLKVLDAKFDGAGIRKAIGETTIVVRGPKPATAIREAGLSPALIAPEPNTWHEVFGIVKDRTERRIAVQEYGRPSTELYEALRAMGAEVTPVTVYQWALPEDSSPLRDAAQQLAATTIDVVLVTSSVQLTHLMNVSNELGIASQVLDGLRKAIIGSVGPTTTETLEHMGLRADVEPAHPKLGMLVKETAEKAPALLASRKTHATD